MFKAACYIKKNTLELRRKLEELGYRNYGNPFQSTDDSYIYTTIDGYYVPYLVRDIDDSWHNCSSNQALFLALAALKDDSDYMQWFIVENGRYHKCESASMDNDSRKYGFSKFRKATPKELIEHFNNK